MTPRARPRAGLALAAAVLIVVAVTAGDVVPGTYLAPGPAASSPATSAAPPGR